MVGSSSRAGVALLWLAPGCLPSGLPQNAHLFGAHQDTAAPGTGRIWLGLVVGVPILVANVKGGRRQTGLYL